MLRLHVCFVLMQADEHSFLAYSSRIYPPGAMFELKTGGVSSLCFLLSAVLFSLVHYDNGFVLLELVAFTWPLTCPYCLVLLLFLFFSISRGLYFKIKKRQVSIWDHFGNPPPLFGRCILQVPFTRNCRYVFCFRRLV